ncbi:MAG: hypothetical protein Q4C75_04770 [Bergeyella zoohelcum]|nr:hypothetical protein [Bergeyella zoohelcum]
MKKKFKIWLMLCVLVAFMLPKQLLSAQTSHKEKAYTTQNADSSHCKHENSKQHHDCNQDNCCDACGHCHILLSFLKLENATEKISVEPFSPLQFMYKTPHFLTPLSEIWQPPKV